MIRRSFVVFALLVVAGLLVACAGGRGDGGNGNGPNDETPSATAAVTPAVTPAVTLDGSATKTPTTFEELRNALRARLEAIGVNIGAVPPDIREELLASCRGLEEYADAERVAQICTAIEEAITRGDPGRIDLVLTQLDELEPK